MEISGLDGRRELVAEFHRLGGSLDFHLVFRLAVFLHAQANGGGDLVADVENRVPCSENSVLGNDDFAFHRAERVGSELLDFQHLFAASVGNDETAGLVGPLVFVRLEVADVAEVKLQVRGVTGLVERPVRDAVGDVAVAVFELGLFHMIGLEPEKRGRAVLLAGDGQPLEMLVPIAGFEQGFSVSIGATVETLGADFHPACQRVLPFKMDRAVADELDLRPRNGRAGGGIGDPPLFFATHVVLHEHRIHDPDERVE